jgi:hypothetical protein
MFFILFNDLSFSICSKICFEQEPPKDDQPKRHPTWSCHTLNLVDRPRSRSFSVTRSTQTAKDLNSMASRDEPKTITFKAELSDQSSKDKNDVTLAVTTHDASHDALHEDPHDTLLDASPDGSHNTSHEEYDGLKFIDDNLEDLECKKEANT